MSTIEPEPIDYGNFFVRLLYIVSFVIILGIVRFVLWGILVLQMVLHLFGASPSPSAQRMGKDVAEYVYRIWLYLSYNTDEKPFPFNGRKAG